MRVFATNPAETFVIAADDVSGLPRLLATEALDGLPLFRSDAPAYEGAPPPAERTRIDRANPDFTAGVDLASYARARSKEIEAAGTEGPGFHLATDRESQGLVDRAVALLTADPSIGSVEFDAGGPEPIVLTLSQLQALGLLQGRYVQSVFSRRGAALRAIAAGTATTRADVDEILSGAAA